MHIEDEGAPEADPDLGDDPIAEFEEGDMNNAHFDAAEATPPRYNLRSRTNPNNDTFRAAMDSP